MTASPCLVKDRKLEVKLEIHNSTLVTLLICPLSEVESALILTINSAHQLTINPLIISHRNSR